MPLKLKAPFDLSFLGKYGKVFKVFDGQDSGNLCFGVEQSGKRYFVKFAGARTDYYTGTIESAVERLKGAVPVYQDLAHPTLIKFVKAEEIGGGFAAVFEWADAECMGKQYPLSRNKFKQMPLDVRVQVLEDIMKFHAYVAGCGYVAIDFYDGSIMYDFTEKKTLICDIDFYAKSPYVNRMGKMWGSSRFMSPEESKTGAEIDEITNVYAMGATAFALLSDSNRSPEKWPLSRKLYDVVKRAVSDERAERQQSIRQLIEEWEAAK